MADKKIIIEQTADLAGLRTAEIFRRIVTECVRRQDYCNVALSGGTTPLATYQLLAREAILDEVPWNKVEIFFGDERDVPQDNVESNFHMVQRALLDNAPIDWAKVHPMRADAEDIKAAAEEYEQLIRQHVGETRNNIPMLDLVMLGMGADGHIASLFPESPSLSEKHKLVMACHVTVLGRNRMTFTFPLINAARHILLLITGDDKAPGVRSVFQDRDKNFPAAWIEPAHGTLHVILDSAAARLL